MKSNFPRLAGFALACVLGQAAAQQVSPGFPAQPIDRQIELDRIVATVNSEVITQYELSERLSLISRQLTARRTPMPPKDVLARQVLERMIIDLVQLQYARETSIKIDDAQLDRAIIRIAETNGTTLTAFRASLERDGVPYAKFRDDIRAEMTIARLKEREVDNRLLISDAEIDVYLKEAAERKKQREEYHLGHILVRVPEQASPEELARRRGRADEALTQLRRGADFGQVAVSFSDAPDALQGGIMGWRGQDRLPALFVEVLAKMANGDVSNVIRSPAGFHILKLNERRGGQDRPVQQHRVRHILIKTNEQVGDEQARRRLSVLRERIAGGADFAQIARLNSNDFSASKGGDLGWVYPGDLVPEFEQAMNSLRIDEVSEPVKSPFGWHLIQVLERRNEDVTAERQRQLARVALRARKADEAYQEWLRQLRDRAYVEYRSDEQ